LKICALTHTYPRFPRDTNGPFVEFLMEELASRGHEVHLLTAWDEQFSADRNGKRVQLHHYRYVWPSRLHLLGYSRTIHADVRLKFGMLLLSPLMLVAGTLAFYRLVRRVQPDLLQAHWFLPNGFMAAIVSQLTGVPLVATLHGSDVFVAEKGGPYRLMTRFTNRTLTRLTSCSPELRDRICATGFPRLQSRVIPYAVDPALETPALSAEESDVLRRQYGLAGCKIILCLGRLVYKKGFEYAIRALPEILAVDPEARLLIAGTGDLEQELQSLARDCGVAQQVIFAGELMRDRIGAHLALADIFLMPSVHDQAGNVDGLPNVILEAMAAGLPVIATEITGIPLAVTDGENGYLVPEQDAAAITATALKLLQSEELRRRFGIRSRELISERLNWREVASSYEQLFNEVIDVRRTTG